MATVTINSLTTPRSCNHIHVGYTVNSVDKEMVMLTSDFQLDPEDEMVALVTLMRNYVKENNITTRLAIKNALEGKTFKL
jgi:hypothetical protein